jgi:hypothetical protein
MGARRTSTARSNAIFASHARHRNNALHSGSADMLEPSFGISSPVNWMVGGSPREFW